MQITKNGQKKLKALYLIGIRRQFNPAVKTASLVDSKLSLSENLLDKEFNSIDELIETEQSYLQSLIDLGNVAKTALEGSKVFDKI